MEAPPAPPPAPATIEEAKAATFSAGNDASTDFAEAASDLTSKEALLQAVISDGGLNSFPVGALEITSDPKSFVVEVQQPTAAPCVPTCNVTTLFAPQNDPI